MSELLQRLTGFALVGAWIFASPPGLAQPSGHYVLVSVQGAGVIGKTPDKTIYELGEAVTLTAAPARYFAFNRWSDGSTANPRTITVGATNMYAAVFTNTVPLESLGISFLWEKTFGGNRNDVLFSLRRTFDGGFMLGGVFGFPSNRHQEQPEFRRI